MTSSRARPRCCSASRGASVWLIDQKGPPRTCRGGPFRAMKAGSAGRVVLDDELDVGGHGDLGALRATLERHLQLVELDLEVARHLGEHVDVATGGGDLEGLELLALVLHVDGLARLHAERG